MSALEIVTLVVAGHQRASSVWIGAAMAVDLSTSPDHGELDSQSVRLVT